jgi:hypothetical protein
MVKDKNAFNECIETVRFSGRKTLNSHGRPAESGVKLPEREIFHKSFFDI